MENQKEKSFFHISSDLKASFDSGYGGDDTLKSRRNSLASNQSPSFSNISIIPPSPDKLVLSLKKLQISKVDTIYEIKKATTTSNNSQLHTQIKLNNSAKKLQNKFSICFDKTPIKKTIRKCLNENEFLNVLSKNHKLPSNPKLLIGHCMGIEKFDVISELNKRSMNTILVKIFGYLNPIDYVSMSQVCSTWKDAVKIDKNVNIKRIKCMKVLNLSKVRI
jgi:hypothetical protein